MKIRIPNFIGYKLYIKYRLWKMCKQSTCTPMIRVESKFYSYPEKTRMYLSVKYYIVIGGR